MNLEQEKSNSVPLPKINYEESLMAPKAPYSVEIDPQAAAAFLRWLGLPEEKIGQTQIRVRGKPFPVVEEIFAKVIGTYRLGTGRIDLFTDWAWEEYQRYLKLAEAIAKGNKKTKSGQFELLYTEKLSNYLTLTQVPLERKMQFAERLVRGGITRDLNRIIHHEGKHELDFKSKRKIITFLGSRAGIMTGALTLASNFSALPGLKDNLVIGEPIRGAMVLGTTLTAIYLMMRYDPVVERPAYEFDAQLANHPKWRQIVKFTPRQTKLENS